MNYTEVHSFLTNQPVQNPIPENIQKVITIASSLSAGFLKRRRVKGALIVYDIFNTYTISEEGKLVFIPKEKHRGYILIQELMILVNAQVADFAVKESVPMLFRTHRVKDDHTSKDDLMREFHLLQVSRDPATLQMIQYRIDHMLELAKYQAKHGEHWALSLPWYTHITSPIRRFADLVNQVNLVAYLREEAYPFAYDDIDAIGRHINQTIVEHEKERTAYAKEKLADEFPQDMTIEWLSGLNPGHMTRNLKLACNIEGIVNGYFIEEIEKRVTEDRLQIIDYTFLLFDQKFATYEKIRRLALKLLVESKVRIKPLYYLLCQRLQIPVPELVAAKTEDGFGASLLFYFGESEHNVASSGAKSKREASENAYLSLLAKMFNIETIKEVKEKVVKVQTIPFVLPGEVPDKNFISVLQESAQKAKVEIPSYNFQDVSKNGVPSFKCTAEITVNGIKFSASAKGLNKKIAKSFTAKALYEKLKKENF
jgi:ribonuclease R